MCFAPSRLLAFGRLLEQDPLHISGVGVLGDRVDEAAADVEDDRVVVLVVLPAAGPSVATSWARKPSRISSGPVHVPATGTSPRSVHVACGANAARSASLSPRCRAAALAELSQDQAGVGSAVLQALNKVGGPLGSAVLGSVLASAYTARVDRLHLPAVIAATARKSVFGGDAAAHQLQSTVVADAVHAAFAHGMDVALSVSAGIAFAGAVLAVVFLPRVHTPDQDGPASLQEEVPVGVQ